MISFKWMRQEWRHYSETCDLPSQSVRVTVHSTQMQK